MTGELLEIVYRQFVRKEKKSESAVYKQSLKPSIRGHN